MAGDPLSTSITPSLKSLFPHRGYASIGDGTFPSMVPAYETNERFNRWAEEKGIDLSKTKRKTTPKYLGYHGFNYNNIFLTGDAASFACTDGELICHAIRALLKHHRSLCRALKVYSICTWQNCVHYERVFLLNLKQNSPGLPYSDFCILLIS